MAQLAPICLLVGRPGHVRSALAGLLACLPGGAPVQCADSGLLALKAVRENHPAVVLVSSSLPETEIPELVYQIKQRWPTTGCVVLAEKAELQRQALYAGADSVLPVGVNSEHILQSVTGLMHR